MGMSDVEHETHDRLVNLQTQIKNMSGDVVLVGDIMLDRYIHGYANNLNSRAPVPVLKETHRHEDVGAAAHVARVHSEGWLANRPPIPIDYVVVYEWG